MVFAAIVTDYFVPLAVLTVFLVLLSWTRYVKGHYRVFCQLDIPGPRPFFLFGNALEFGKMFPLDLYIHWNKKFGSIFGYYEGLQPSVVVTCPELAHEILVKQFHSFSSRPTHAPFLWEREDRSLQNSNGSLWKRQRQAVTGGMSGRCIREMFPVVQRITNDLLAEIDRAMSESQQGFRVDELMERYSVQVIAEATLGYQSNAFSDEDDVTLRYMQAAHESASAENFASGFARLFPSLTSVLKPLDRKHKFWAENISKAAQRFVNLTKQDPHGACPVMRSLWAHGKTEPDSTVKSGNSDHPFPSRDADSNDREKYHGGKPSHLRCEEETGENSQINRHSKTAASLSTKNHDNETSSSIDSDSKNVSHTDQSSDDKTQSVVSDDGNSRSLTSSDQGSGRPGLSEEDIVDQVMGLLTAGLGPLAVAMTFVIYCLAVYGEEQERVVREIEDIVSCKDTVSIEELKRMKALERFISESMRMFPVAPGVTRECVEDCVVSGHKFTRGMVVRVMSWVMYRQEQNFQNVSHFDPDRFKGHFTKHAWMPFGHGPRKCVADRLASLVFKLCTVRILQRLQVCASKDTQVPLQLALRPFLVPRDGVHVKFVERT